MTTATETVWISVASAARLLDKDARTVRYYAEQGRLRSKRVGDRGWLKVSYEDVLRLRAED